MSKRFIIIALDQDCIDTTIAVMNNKFDKADIDWLKVNQQKVYGALPEDWKPFKSESIKDKFQRIARGEFEFDTLEGYPGDSSWELPTIWRRMIASIHVYVIDGLSVYSSKHNKLQALLDLPVDVAGIKALCLWVIPNELPAALQKDIKKMLRESWPCAILSRQDGRKHDWIYEDEDLDNFIGGYRDNTGPAIGVREVMSSPDDPKNSPLLAGRRAA